MGMADLVLRGCGELSRAGMAELCLRGYDGVGAGEGVLVGWGAVGVGLEVGELALQRLDALVDAGGLQVGGDGG